jgi:hypothetical protein
MSARELSARELARQAGEKTFRGKPCLRGHAGLRKVANGNCVACSLGREQVPTRQKHALQRNTIYALLYAQEFDALGWRWRAASPNSEEKAI